MSKKFVRTFDWFLRMTLLCVIIGLAFIVLLTRMDQEDQTRMDTDGLGWTRTITMPDTSTITLLTEEHHKQIHQEWKKENVWNPNDLPEGGHDPSVIMPLDISKMNEGDEITIAACGSWIKKTEPHQQTIAIVRLSKTIGTGVLGGEIRPAREIEMVQNCTVLHADGDEECVIEKDNAGLTTLKHSGQIGAPGGK